jgi:uncharacterized protein (UPF0333 family)
MNYQDYIKYDPEKKQYTDSYGYVIDGFSSKVLPTELNTAGEAIAIANGAVATANAAAASIAAVNNGNFQTVTAGYGLNNQLTITTNNAGVATIVPTGTSSNIDVIINPKGLGIVDCKSYTAEYNTGMGSTQTLGTNVNTKVRFDNSIMNNFPAGFITAIDLGGWVYDTFQNTSGRTIALMVTACIRETTFPTGRTLGLWIARTGDSSLRYGQALLPPTTDTTNGRALNTASIIRLANTESFSVWAHTVADGVVIGGNGQLYNRPILSFRLIP